MVKACNKISLCFILFFSFLISNAQVCFNPISIYTVGTGTTALPIGGVRALTSADFNGDGNLDIAVANNNTNMYFIQVLLGNASGAFTNTINSALSTTSQPITFTSADFNGDGKPDLAVIQYNKTISILLGTGTGSFTAASSISVGVTMQNIKSVDFNGDGKQDLLVAKSGAVGDSVPVYFGMGNGSFILQKFKIGYGQWRVITTDFNNDTKPDILSISNSGTIVISLLLGTGTGSFGAVAYFNLNNVNNVQDIINADFNADGNQDIAITDYSTSICVLLGTGTGSFLPATSFPAGVQPYAIVSSDYNGDGKLDIVVSNYSVNTVSILYGNGTGSFSVPNIISNNIIYPYSIISTDFDGNSKADLAVGNYFNPEAVTILLNKLPFYNVAISTPSICYGNSAVITVTGDVANTYSWSTNQTATSIVVSPTITSNYTVTANANSCAHSKVINLLVDPCDKVGVNFMTKNNSISVYPNPYNSMLYVESTNETILNIKILDVFGKLILEQKVAASNKQSFDLDGFSKGIYFVEISLTDGNVTSIKVIK